MSLSVMHQRFFWNDLAIPIAQPTHRIRARLWNGRVLDNFKKRGSLGILPFRDCISLETGFESQGTWFSDEVGG